MSDIKDCFVSRFPEGCIVEMDYSQLEVVGLAVLSNDPVLKDDLRSGKDIHCINTANLHGVPYHIVKHAYDTGDKEWTAKRKIAKAFSFQLQYGAGYKSMARDNGVHEKFAKKFIDVYYKRYSRVKDWQDENIEIVKRSSDYQGKKTRMGFPAKTGVMLSPTGRMYEFTEQDSPDWMKERGEDTSFSPTQIKNYPVQGFATGDIVPLAFGQVWQYIMYNRLESDIKLINTIHDSLIFDVSGNLDEIGVSNFDSYGHLKNIKELMEDIPVEIKSIWPLADFDMELHVDVEVGKNWGAMAPLDI